MDAAALTAEIKSAARRLGFQLAGAAPALTPTGLGRFHEWLASGYAGQMHYLPERAEAYEHPQHVLAGVRSVVMLAMNYGTGQPQPTTTGQGRIARYAWGTVDYHDLIHDRLKQLTKEITQLAPAARVRGVVDTAPLMERELAQLAGLGWVGKNTLLLNRGEGSWFFLAALLTDLELAYDDPHMTDHCGSCTACLEACPTDAFPQPYVLDATRCISYLTIELRDHIPTELREGMGDWLFGCDVCQEVCPWNRRAPAAEETAFAPQPASDPVDLIALFSLDDAAFRDRFRRTPLWRSKRRGILRNAAILLGNRPTSAALPALTKGLTDKEPLIRAACAWALGHYAENEAQDALAAQNEREQNAAVLSEIQAALRLHA